MKTILLSLLFFPILTMATTQDLNSPEELARRCSGPENGAVLLRSDFHWGTEFQEMLAKALEIRTSGKRLPRRAFYDSAKETLALPYDAARGGDVVLNPVFIRSVQRHVEEAIRLGYVDAIFFPDMGHSHLLIPQKSWDEDYSGRPVAQQARLYERFFSDPNVKIFYHTAEQLKMKDEDGQLLPDRHLQWRFYTRNLAGDNRGEGRLEVLQNLTHSYNTVGEVPGYRWWGAGFNISGSDQGCIAYRHGDEVRYFDLSLYDL
ncbi:MAG: hypothetical protein KF789_11040 [Bdellovibrionaceae bacterium]|nr:hypothetical protein [Pseudobdellovibrionaceae bacterium]